MGFHTTETRARAIALYESGMSRRKAADEVGMSGSLLRKWLIEAGKLRPPAKSSAALKRRVVRLRADGWSMIKIAEMVDRPLSTINGWLKQERDGRLLTGRPPDAEKVDPVQVEAARARAALAHFIPRPGQ